MKNLLVTGGCGFIGSNFVLYLLENYNDIKVVNLDALTYAGNLENLASIEDEHRYTFIKGDIRDQALLQRMFAQYNFDTVVNFAAESHVDRSITDPGLFLDVNAGGTLALLEAALHAWRQSPNDKYCRDFAAGTRFLQVSTDEVYGSLTALDPQFTELNNLRPSSPYSASKTSADCLVLAYHTTYGLPVNITRCSNNYGPFQFPEKLIPLMIRNAGHEIKLPVYGDGMQIRDWLYVEDHCSAICAVLEGGRDGECYNVGGNNEKANIQIVKLILGALGKSQDLIEYVQDRPGHDRRYAIDNSKITAELGWAPKHRFEDGIVKTINWYLANLTWVENVTSGRYLDYYQSMYGQGSAD